MIREVYCGSIPSGGVTNKDKAWCVTVIQKLDPLLYDLDQYFQEEQKYYLDPEPVSLHTTTISIIKYFSIPTKISAFSNFFKK